MVKSCSTTATGSALKASCSKRLSSRYMSGPSHRWIKVKCRDRKRINVERHKLLRFRASPS